jgi:diguanylate cyclase (GGDEF)-like protein
VPAPRPTACARPWTARVAADDRLVAEADRAMAAEDRARSREDRARAAEDRHRAAEDRARALEARRQAILDIQRASVDELTGVSTRAVGLVALLHALDHAHEAGEPLVLVFVDINRLKEVNDRSGHAAGDAVLRAVGAALRTNLRAEDPIVRVGGDEFVCMLGDTTLHGARGHLAEVEAALRATTAVCTISCGLVELRPEEQLDELMARGDAELYRIKNGRSAA